MLILSFCNSLQFCIILKYPYSLSWCLCLFWPCPQQNKFRKTMKWASIVPEILVGTQKFCSWEITILQLHFRTFSGDSTKIKNQGNASHSIWQWSQSTVLKLQIAPSNTKYQGNHGHSQWVKNKEVILLTTNELMEINTIPHINNL